NTLSVNYNISNLKKMVQLNDAPEIVWKYVIEFPIENDLATVKSSFIALADEVKKVRYDIYAYLCTDYTPLQWNMGKIYADEAYQEIAEIEAPESPVIVAVIDTGIDYNHPDLADNMLLDENGAPKGYNAIDSEEDFDDNNGHGTLVAGTIAAVTNSYTQQQNGESEEGIASLVNRNDLIKLLPIKAFNNEGDGYVSDIESGVYAAINRDAKVINLSFEVLQTTEEHPVQGEPGYEEYWEYYWALLDLETAFACCTNIPRREVLVVNSAGKRRTEEYNAINDFFYILTVASTDRDNNKSYNSPIVQGEHELQRIEIAAPGGIFSLSQPPHHSNNIISTLPFENTTYYFHYSQQGASTDEIYDYNFGGWNPPSGAESDYDFAEGTSLSAGYVTGLIAILTAKYSSELDDPDDGFGRQEIWDIITESATPVGSGAEYCGSGIINAGMALKGIQPYIQIENELIIVNEREYTQDENIILEWNMENSMTITLHNDWADANNVTGTFEILTEDVNCEFSNGVWGNIEQLSWSTNQIPISIEPEYGFTGEFTARLTTYDGGTELQSFDFNFEVVQTELAINETGYEINGIEINTGVDLPVEWGHENEIYIDLQNLGASANNITGEFSTLTSNVDYNISNCTWGAVGFEQNIVNSSPIILTIEDHYLGELQILLTLYEGTIELQSFTLDFEVIQNGSTPLTVFNNGSQHSGNQV
ncbi:MAG: S8 family serine peptidase, partial [Candidatus Cloacimonadota bacterium]|nr:S8 family serine peptidase [Candidatus Cloacimonadota bacterium]